MRVSAHTSSFGTILKECTGVSRALLPLFRETRASTPRALRLSFRCATSLSLSLEFLYIFVQFCRVAYKKKGTRQNSLFPTPGKHSDPSLFQLVGSSSPALSYARINVKFRPIFDRP
jgi:hypothetical protein